jgi:hypothetical protein
VPMEGMEGSQSWLSFRPWFATVRGRRFYLTPAKAVSVFMFEFSQWERQQASGR